MARWREWLLGAAVGITLCLSTLVSAATAASFWPRPLPTRTPERINLAFQRDSQGLTILVMLGGGYRWTTTAEGRLTLTAYARGPRRGEQVWHVEREVVAADFERVWASWGSGRLETIGVRVPLTRAELARLSLNDDQLLEVRARFVTRSGREYTWEGIAFF